MMADEGFHGSTPSFTVELIRRVVVRAGGCSPSSLHTLPLSNLDYLHPYQVSVIYFYPKPAAGCALASIADAVERSIAASLMHFPHLAGRIVPHPVTGLPEVWCNNEGAEMIQAYADVSLANLDLCHLDRSVKKIYQSPDAEFPLSAQLTGYACGGFSIFWSCSHMLADAAAFGLFLLVWAEVSRGEEISRHPQHDRMVFSTRPPLRYGPLLDRTFVKCGLEDVVRSQDERVSIKRMYYVEAPDIDRLRELASCEDGKRSRTRVEAFSAYVWKMLARAASPTEPGARCNMGWAVDGRQVMGARGPGASLSDYFGNVVSMAVGEMSVGSLLEGSLPEVSRVVSQTIGAVKNRSHFLELVDWIELHKPGVMWPRFFLGGGGGAAGPVLPPLVLSFCHRMVPVGELDFGFGPPSLGCCYSAAEKLSAALLNVFPGVAEDGSWVVFAHVWAELADLLDSDGASGGVFRRLTGARPSAFADPQASVSKRVLKF